MSKRLSAVSAAVCLLAATSLPAAASREKDLLARPRSEIVFGPDHPKAQRLPVDDATERIELDLETGIPSLDDKGPGRGLELPLQAGTHQKNSANGPPPTTNDAADLVRKTRQTPDRDIYTPIFLKKLFDGVAVASYEKVVDIASLGQSRYWRSSAVHLLDLKKGDRVADLMGGTGEAWHYIAPKLGSRGEIVSVDFSKEMTVAAGRRKAAKGYGNVRVIEGDATAVPALADGTVDAVISNFGIKTLHPDLAAKFVGEIRRILKPGGRFAVLEVTVPKSRLMRLIQHIYMRSVFPLFLKVIAGNHKGFLMVNEFLARFDNGEHVLKEFERQGFTAGVKRKSFGYATIIHGSREDSPKPIARQALPTTPTPPTKSSRPAGDPMPFPDLAAMMGQSLGMKRPARAALKPLPPFPDAPSLPREVLATLMERMANRQNWSDVAYGASSQDVKGKVMAEWVKRDAIAEINEYFGQLNEAQRQIANAAFKGGMAEIPDFHRIVPETVTFDWVQTNYPSRP